MHAVAWCVGQVGDQGRKAGSSRKQANKAVCIGRNLRGNARRKGIQVHAQKSASWYSCTVCIWSFRITLFTKFYRTFLSLLHICTLMTAGNPSWGCVQMSNLIGPLLTLTLAGHSSLFDKYIHLNEPKNTQMTSNMILLCILWNVVKDISKWTLFYEFTRFYAFP